LDASILSQLIHGTFLPLCCEPHQNLLIKELRDLQRVLGRRKTLIAYVGMAKNFLACKRNFSFQPSNFFPTLHWIPAKVFFFARPTMAGNPRYFS